ncbi:hypothetical protein [Oerskovia turbata]
MRSHTTRFVLLSACLGVAAVALAGCTSAATPAARAEATVPPPPSPGLAAEYDASTPAGALLLAASTELDAAILPPGFAYVDTTEIDHAGSTSAVYVHGQPEDQGPGLYVYASHTGVEVEHLGDAWQSEPLPALSDEMAVTVVTDPEGHDRSVVTIDAPPAGTVRLIGDGVARDDLIAMAGRMLDSVG